MFDELCFLTGGSIGKKRVMITTRMCFKMNLIEKLKYSLLVI